MSKVKAFEQLERIYKEDKDAETCQAIDRFLRDLANFMSAKELEEFAQFVKKENQ